MNSEQIKHLEFIQNVINRMNANSFQMKSWMITIVSALLALYASSSNVSYIFIAIAPTIVFWWQDAYYLQQERKFRGLYNDIVIGNDIRLFAMPIDNYKGGFYCYFRSLFSKTVGLLYGSIGILLLIAGLIIKYKDCLIICKC